VRVVILAPSTYSETSCAVAAHLAELGHIPVGALVLSTLNAATLLRKLGQWSPREVARYASTKMIPQLRGDDRCQVVNPYLGSLLQHGGRLFRNLREVASLHGFPIVRCQEQNAPDSIAQLREWSPDLVIFTGGNILRKEVLNIPRLGVLNVHLALLPEIRGMSSPEWSLLNNVPVGVTIHYMDAGIDTGPILRRYEFPHLESCASLNDLRNRLIAFGIEKIGEVVTALDRSTVVPRPQPDIQLSDIGQIYVRNGSQFFVMHESLKARAAQRLAQRVPAEAVRA